MTNKHKENKDHEYNLKNSGSKAVKNGNTMDGSIGMLRIAVDFDKTPQGLKAYYEKLVKDYRKVQKKLKPHFDAGLKEDKSNLNVADTALLNLVNEYDSTKTMISNYLTKYGMFIKKRKNAFGRFSEELYNDWVVKDKESHVDEGYMNLEGQMMFNYSKNRNSKKNNVVKGRIKLKNDMNDENQDNLKEKINSQSLGDDIYNPKLKNQGGEMNNKMVKKLDNNHIYMKEKSENNIFNLRAENLDLQRQAYQNEVSAPNNFYQNGIETNFELDAVNLNDDIYSIHLNDMKPETIINLPKENIDFYSSYPVKTMNQKNSPEKKTNKRSSNSNEEEYCNNKGYHKKISPNSINDRIYNKGVAPYEKINRFNDDQISQNNNNYGYPGMAIDQNRRDDSNYYFYNNTELKQNKSNKNLYQTNKESNLFNQDIYEQKYFKGEIPNNVYYEQTVNPNVFFNETTPSPSFNSTKPMNPHQSTIKKPMNIDRRKEVERRNIQFESTQENFDMFINQHVLPNRNITMDQGYDTPTKTPPLKMRTIDAKRIEECLGDVNLSDDGKAYLLEMCDLFIESVCYTSCCISKNRNSKNLDIEDIKLAIKTDSSFEIPDDNIYSKNIVVDSEHEKRVGMVCKENNKRNKM